MQTVFNTVTVAPNVYHEIMFFLLFILYFNAKDFFYIFAILLIRQALGKMHAIT